MATKQLAMDTITDEVVGRTTQAINSIARNVTRLNTSRTPQEFTTAVRLEIEQLYHLLLGLATENEKDISSAFLSLIPGSDCTIIHSKNNEILSYLEIHRPQCRSLLSRMLFNKYTLVGAPVVFGTLGFLYRKQLAPAYADAYQGIQALLDGNVSATQLAGRASDLLKKASEALAQAPQLPAAQLAANTARKLYGVARNERKRKTIALGVLGTVSAALMCDTYRHKPTNAQEARTRGTYAPSRLLSYLNNSLRFSSSGGSQLKMVLGLPLAVVGLQAAIGLLTPTETGGYHYAHLPKLLSMRSNWLYAALGAARARIAAEPDRVGFKLYGKLVPFFAGSPTKVAIFTILTAGLASRSLRAMYDDYNNDQLSRIDKIYYGIIGTSETIGAVVLAALLTNWLTERPGALAA